jgi:hypothetical protein
MTTTCVRRRIRAIAAAVVLGGVSVASGQVSDGSFETTAQPNNGFFYNPAGSPWTFGSTSGIIRPPSDFGSPAAPDGAQIAFLQTNPGDSHHTGVPGSITQTVTIPSAGPYVFSATHARRGGPVPQYELLLNGVNYGGVRQAPLTTFTSTSSTMVLPAGTYTLALNSTAPGDSTTFLDAVSLAPAANANAGTYSSRPFTGDADSGISSSKTYTHAVDFLGSGATTINGVLFDDVNATGPNYALTAPNSFNNNTGNNALTGGARELVDDFRYGGTETLLLSGLTPGQTYTTTFYDVGWGNVGGRVVDISDSQGGFYNGFDANYTGNGNGHLLQYTYTAASGSITFTIVPLVAGDSFHQYAFTNELVAVPEPGAVAGVLLLGAVAMRRRQTR